MRGKVTDSALGFLEEMEDGRAMWLSLEHAKKCSKGDKIKGADCK